MMDKSKKIEEEEEELFRRSKRTLHTPSKSKPHDDKMEKAIEMFPLFSPFNDCEFVIDSTNFCFGILIS